MTKLRMPQTDSIQELADFWDTHDLTEFEDDLEEVDTPVFEREAELRLRLPEPEAAAIHALAKSRGVTDTKLVRDWVLEKLHAT